MSAESRRSLSVARGSRPPARAGRGFSPRLQPFAGSRRPRVVRGRVSAVSASRTPAAKANRQIATAPVALGDTISRQSGPGIPGGATIGVAPPKSIHATCSLLESGRVEGARADARCSSFASSRRVDSATFAWTGRKRQSTPETCHQLPPSRMTTGVACCRPGTVLRRAGSAAFPAVARVRMLQAWSED